MHNSVILKRQYWANPQKIKKGENMKEQNYKQRSGGKKSDAAQIPRTQRRIRKKVHRQSSEKNAKTQRSKSALKISPRSNVGGEWQKGHDQS